MTFEEYRGMIDKIISDPDSAAATAEEILKELEKDTTSLDTLEQMHEENEKRIKELQETNLKLFMSRGGAGAEEPPEDEEPTAPGKERAEWIASHLDSGHKSYYDDKYKKGET